VRSLISLFKRPFIFRQTFPSSSPASDSSELSLSATKRSTQPSGSGSWWIFELSAATIRLFGFFGGCLSVVPLLEAGWDDEDVDDVGIVGTD